MKTTTLLLFISISLLHAHAQSTEAYSWSHLPQAAKPTFKADTFNVVAYGAINGGLTLCTESINNAIKDCSAKGGGVVLIPQGLWISGPIVLQSNVNLHISRSALLQFTADKSQYHLIEGNFEGHKAIRNESPISGTNLTNIAITGEGVVDGHGEVWRAMGKDRVTENEWKQMTATGVISNDGRTWYPSESYARGAQLKDPTRAPSGGSLDAIRSQVGSSIKDYENIKDFFRPNLLVLNNCKQVLLQNTCFQNSPAWCLHFLQCEDLTLNGVRVRNEANAQNGDGMDIESCSRVLVENCTLDCGDDGICIKSGKDEEGRRVGKASQYIVVRNNVVYKAHGGFVIGSEMSGGAHDIFVYDCTFIGTDNGLRFKTVRGRGGIVENIYIRNINMHDIVHDAILFDMYYFTKAPTLAQTNGKVDIPPVGEGTPQFRKFYISNLVCEGAERAMIIRGLPEMSIRDISLENVIIKAKRGADIIEAQNIALTNVTLSCDQTQPLINIENSQQLTFTKLQSPTPPALLFSINGDRTKQINLAQTSPSLSPNTADFKYGAPKSSLNISK
ncbi:MAG: glycoside hydrolase family 28 protein [Bacteroidetes bacterium]|nr:glycoside hydrolase family 28 protein [Bacteroidota bacterium]